MRFRNLDLNLLIAFDDLMTECRLMTTGVMADKR